MAKRIIYAVDIGSTRCERGSMPNFAWVRVDPAAGIPVGTSDISALAGGMIRDLEDGHSIAIGFESPLFIPVPVEASALCHGRKNEGNRSFAAPIGSSVATIGLHQAAWILGRIADSYKTPFGFETKASAWPPRDHRQILFCWEAFISNHAHGTHLQDAATAAMAFLSAEGKLAEVTTITAERPLSLIAVAARWSGLTKDIATLHRPTVVIRPQEPFVGEIKTASGGAW